MDFNLRCIIPGTGLSSTTGTFFSNKSLYPTYDNPQTFELVLSPQIIKTADTIKLAFDLLGYDAAKDINSWVYLEDVFIEEITLIP
jgi:hypothetical protein